MAKNKLPEFVKILHKDKTVLVDPENRVCLKVSGRIAQHLDKPEVQEKLYPIWREQSELQKIIEAQREKINTAYLMVTRQCNMNCKFCAMNANQGMDLGQEFKISDIKEKVVPFFREVRPHKLIVSGGEPLLKGNILEIIKTLHSGLACPITLQSNGLLADKDVVEGLKGNIAEIDFSTRHMLENPAGESALRNHIMLCQEAGIQVVLSFIYEKTNRRNLYRVIDIAAEYDTGLLVNSVSPVGRARENSEILSELDKMEMNLDIAKYTYDRGYQEKAISNLEGRPVRVRDSCGAYGKILAVFPEGNVYMCQCLEKETYCLGNLLEAAPDHIRKKLSAKLHEKEIRESFCVQEKVPCNRCEYRYLCGGNCPLSDKAEAQECFFTKKMIDYQLFYMGQPGDKREALQRYIHYLEEIKKEYFIKKGLA